MFLFYREHAPSIIFMDEIDSIGSTRLEGGSGSLYLIAIYEDL
jgi:26S proteasome regulatory subunit T6